MLHPNHKPTIKFLCSYRGKILPRYPDRKLYYHGGETRVLVVDRSISFCELSLKMGEMCGTSVSLRCQLPTEDLDALVSITSDEELAYLIEEYDRTPPVAFPLCSSKKSTTNNIPWYGYRVHHGNHIQIYVRTGNTGNCNSRNAAS
ncbi:hypothetical protein GOBAR_DD19004 [Gossypium barbadense]|nr:hypothetical protein GOBAR_DD19004 [Gossypium barbadense]